MFFTQPKFRIALTAISLLNVAMIYHGLSEKSAFVSGCRGRLAQLELIAAQNTRNEAALDAREKALDAAEAHLNSIKQ
jgi:hypothetical protein